MTVNVHVRVPRSKSAGRRVSVLVLVVAMLLVVGLLPAAAVAPEPAVAVAPEPVAAAVPASGAVLVSDGGGLVPSVRFAGVDRFDTARLVASGEDPWGAGFSGETVVLATGADFPDALAGSTAAGLEDAPIVLTRRTRRATTAG